jgi:hypothetical protein
LGLCKKPFLGASRRIIFLETPHFWNFANRNFKNDASLRRIFCCRRRQKPFYTTPFHIEAALDSLILRSKINESSAASNYYLARSAVKHNPVEVGEL